MRPACLLVVSALLACDTAVATTQFNRFKLPGPGLYEQTSVVRGPGPHVARDTARLCATPGTPPPLSGLPADLQAQCSARVLEDSATRGRFITECSAGSSTETLIERTAPDAFRTTIIVRQGGREFSRAIVDSRRVADECPMALSAPSPVTVLPKAAAPDPAVCAEGKAELARMRTNTGIPAATREQIMAGMQTGLRAQGCKL